MFLPKLNVEWILSSWKSKVEIIVVEVRRLGLGSPPVNLKFH